MLLPMPEINALSRGNQCLGLAFDGLAGFEIQRSCFAVIKTYRTRFPAGIYKGPGEVFNRVRGRSISRQYTRRNKFKRVGGPSPSKIFRSKTEINDRKFARFLRSCISR